MLGFGKIVSRFQNNNFGIGVSRKLIFTLIPIILDFSGSDAPTSLLERLKDVSASRLDFNILAWEPEVGLFATKLPKASIKHYQPFFVYGYDVSIG